MSVPADDQAAGPFPFQRVLSVCDLSEQGNDLEYWLGCTPAERILALEYMRHMLYGCDPVNDRIQRVLEIADLKPG